MSIFNWKHIRYVFIAAFLLSSILFVTSFPGSAKYMESKIDMVHNVDKKGDFVSDRVIVKYKNGVEISDPRINQVKSNNRELDLMLINQGITESKPLFTGKAQANLPIINELSQIHTLKLKEGSK